MRGNSRAGTTIMLTAAIRLLLFPALMAFAAWSDLLITAISNQLSLCLPPAFSYPRSSPA